VSVRSLELTASFTPKRLGVGTTVRLGVDVLKPVGAAPSPPTQMKLLLPAGLSIATSDLGLDTCSLPQLESEGLLGCPTNSLMGHGTAVAEVPFGSHFVLEQTRVTLFSGPLQDGHPKLLFLASGEYPVLADIAFAASVLPAGKQFGGMLDTTLPLIPGVPHGPNVALVGFRMTIGPSGITYYDTSKGRRVGFHPRGITVPLSCPHGGFPFAVKMTFQDGGSASRETRVPCPRATSARNGAHPRGDRHWTR
jgi:hypothetical protein